MSFFDDPALDNPFWQFSLNRYARRGVAAACLALQDRAEIDVNLLLFAFWLGHGGYRLADYPDAMRPVVAWHEAVVKPLRHARIARRQPEGAPENPIRAAIKQVELQAEQIEQALLFRLADGLMTETGSGSQADMVHNARSLMPALAIEDDALGRLALLCL